jgi:hypothetical protein
VEEYDILIPEASEMTFTSMSQALDKRDWTNLVPMFDLHVRYGSNMPTFLLRTYSPHSRSQIPFLAVPDPKLSTYTQISSEMPVVGGSRKCGLTTVKFHVLALVLLNTLLDGQ